jgi:DNA-binding transcriptional MerR regulator
MSGRGRRYSIGELSRLTGLSVRTLRFYADSGVVPAAGRTEAGYRLYDDAALTRLALVRTLRDLDVDLATIRRVLAREVSIAEVAATHAQVLEVQIRTLQLRRAVLRAVAERGATPEEIERMHHLTRLSNDEQHRIINEFLDEVFGGLAIDPDFEQRMRGAMPALPENPSADQIEAWVELAELVQDQDFRQRIRRMAEDAAAARAAGESQDGEAARNGANLIMEKAGAAFTAGIAPDSPEAAAVAGEIAAGNMVGTERVSDPVALHRLADRLQMGTDRRAERYWQLLATINGWPPIPTMTPVFEWAIAALRAAAARSA